jgi:hypothetical protein
MDSLRLAREARGPPVLALKAFPPTEDRVVGLGVPLAENREEIEPGACEQHSDDGVIPQFRGAMEGRETIAGAPSQLPASPDSSSLLPDQSAAGA